MFMTTLKSKTILITILEVKKQKLWEAKQYGWDREYNEIQILV